MDTTLMTFNLWQLDPSTLKLFSSLQQLFLFRLMFFDLFLKHLGNGLVCTWVEVICENDLPLSSNVCVMVDSWIKIKEYREVHRLIWVEQLVLEAEALDLIEVESCLLRADLVDSYTSHRLV